MGMKYRATRGPLCTRRGFAVLAAAAAAGLTLGTVGCAGREEKPAEPSSASGEAGVSSQSSAPASAPQAQPIPAGSLCVTEYAGNTVAVLDPADGSLLLRLPAGENPVALAFDDRRLYVGCSGSSEVRAYRLDDASQTQAIATGEQPLGMALDAERGRLYVAGYLNSHIMVVDTALGSMTGRAVLPTTGFRNRTDPPDCCRVGPGVGRRPVALALAPDGSAVYSANYGTYDVAVVDTQAMEETTSFDGVVGPRQLLVSADGERLYVAGVGGEDDQKVADLAVCDRESGARLCRLPVGDGVAGVAQSADGTLLASIAHDKGNVVVFDAESLEESGRCRLEEGIEAVAMAPDGSLIYVANPRLGTISIVDGASLEVVGMARGLAGPKNLLLLP